MLKMLWLFPINLSETIQSHVFCPAWQFLILNLVQIGKISR